MSGQRLTPKSALPTPKIRIPRNARPGDLVLDVDGGEWELISRTSRPVLSPHAWLLVSQFLLVAMSVSLVISIAAFTALPAKPPAHELYDQWTAMED